MPEPTTVMDSIEAARTVEGLAACIDAYRSANPPSAFPGAPRARRARAGGSLHIVLDDFAYDDSTVRWCVEYAEAAVIAARGGRPAEHKEADPVSAALGRKLLEFTVEDRAAANDRERCECGHAMSLHSWWDPGGGYGYSRKGPCESSTCGCQDAVLAAVAAVDGHG